MTLFKAQAIQTRFKFTVLKPNLLRHVIASTLFALPASCLRFLDTYSDPDTIYYQTGAALFGTVDLISQSAATLKRMVRIRIRNEGNWGSCHLSLLGESIRIKSVFGRSTVRVPLLFQPESQLRTGVSKQKTETHTRPDE